MNTNTQYLTHNSELSPDDYSRYFDTYIIPSALKYLQNEAPDGVNAPVYELK